MKKTATAALLLLTMLSTGASASLVAHYKLDGNVNDSSGNKINATDQGGGAYTADRFGNANRAYYFDGNDYIQTPVGSNSLPLSFSVWFKADNATGERSIVDSDVSSQYGHSLIIDYALASPSSGNTLDVQYHDGAKDSGVSVTAGTWYHAVVNFSGGASGVIQLYINGVQIDLNGSSDGNDLPYTPGTVNGSDFRLGAHNSGDRQWFKGAIDDVRFYNHALTQAEVSELYAVPIPAAVWLLGSGLAGLVVARRKFGK